MVRFPPNPGTVARVSITRTLASPGGGSLRLSTNELALIAPDGLATMSTVTDCPAPTVSVAES